MKKTIVCLLAILLILAFVSCDSSVPKNIYTVTFDTDGGSAVEPVEVTEGDKVTKPVDPTKEGFTFEGWYIGEDAYDFEAPVTKAITLKAKWTEVSAPVVKHTVTFNANGAEGVCPSPISANLGETITIPGGDALSNKDYLFKEWNTEKNGTGTSYKENDEIIANNHLTLYAILEKNPLTFNLLADSVSYSVKCKDRNAQSVVIPSKYQGNPVTTIDKGAFDNFTSLKSITIPSSVTKICKSAFWNCSSLETIIYQGTIEAWKAMTRESGWAVGIKAKEIQCTNGKTPIN